MRPIRKVLLNLAPTIAWTLLFMILYTLFMSKIQEFKEIVIPDETLYYKSFMIVIPVAIIAFTVKKTKYLWQYLLVASAIIAGMYVITDDLLLVLITVGLCFTRLVSRLSGEENLLDSVQGVMIAVFVAIFVMVGYTGEVYIQKMTLYHMIYVALLYFTSQGLQRFESYIMIRESRANVAASKILDTGTKIFGVTILLVLIIVLPLMKYQYEFVSFSLPQFEQSDEVWEEEVKVEQTQQKSEGSSLMDMLPKSEPNPYLVMFWEVLSDIMVLAVYVAFAYAIIKGVRTMIRNYKAPQIETYDVIESTFVQTDGEVRTRKGHSKFEELFDFSKEMNIRRRYKKTLNKFHPKAYQTPTEMEVMAELDIPNLHEQYEEVRYGKHS